jgi:WD40 repeat protein
VEFESLNWQSNPTGSPITAVAIRDDGRMARAAGGRITISDTTRGDLQTFSTTTVTSLAFSPVGDRLAVATADGKVQWHDASTGLDLALPNRIPGKVGCMHWIADSDELLVMLAQGGSVNLATPATVNSADALLPTSLGWRLSENGQIIPDASHVPSDGSPRSPRTK